VSQLSQGTTVSFAGSPIGSLIGVTGSGGSAVMADITSAASSLVGSSGNSRIRKQADCLGIEPGSVTVRLLGMPPYSPTSIGQKGSLSFSTPGGSMSGEACLESYEVEASVGELLRGSATFAFTGS
jgi:hypothetical protein